jgi:hypothetical protein
VVEFEGAGGVEFEGVVGDPGPAGENLGGPDDAGAVRGDGKHGHSFFSCSRMARAAHIPALFKCRCQAPSLGDQRKPLAFK